MFVVDGRTDLLDPEGSVIFKECLFEWQVLILRPERSDRGDGAKARHFLRCHL
jgi:hypothetical protein